MKLYRVARRGEDAHLATYNGSVGWGRRFGAGEPAVQATFAAAEESGRQHVLLGTAEETERLIRDLVAGAAALTAGDHTGADAPVRAARAREEYIRHLAELARVETWQAEAEYERWFGHLSRAEAEAGGTG